jgi:DNA repair protein RadD
MIILRHYQNTMVNGIRDSFRNLFSAVLAVLPTGGGKTVVFTFIAQAMSLKRKKVIILVHRIELLRQTSTALSKFDVEHGMINPQYTPKFTSNVQIASVQTIIKRLNYFVAINWVADTIIIDECHHANSASWVTIVAHFKAMNPNLKIIGVTATPIRGDGQGLGVQSGGMFEDMVIGPQVQDLINEGFLVKPRIFGPPEKLDLSNLHSEKGDYKKSELLTLVDKPKITGSAVEHYKELCPGTPAVVFCVRVEHAEHVAQQFRDAGFKFYAVDGSMDDDIRKRILGGLANGTVDGVCSCDLISEGTDIPAIGCAILLRPTKSKGLYLQQVGRALRPCEGKEYAFVLDHVGNTEAHGLPYQYQEWTLDGSIKKRGSKSEEPPVRVIMCESCFMQQEPTTVCVGCGHVMKPPKNNTPKQVEGKLREITEADIKKASAKLEQSKAHDLAGLLKIAEQRGFSPKWAEHVNMARLKKLEKLQMKNPVIEFPVIEENEFQNDLNF